jgi:mannose-6-phosphate isomerase-like protein (cupin superfamily)
MPEPRYRHADEEKWHEVRAVEIEGRRACVREKWLEFTPKMLTLHAKWDPGMMIHKHGHQSDHILYVLEGEMMCGEVRCTKGMHVTLEEGASFGPFVAGPEGVELFEVMMGDPRSWPADPAGFETLLASKNAKKLPNPPIELPDWLEDTRSE